VTPGSPGDTPPPALSPQEAAALAKAHGLTPLGARPAFGDYVRSIWRRRSFLWTLSQAEAAEKNAEDRLGMLWTLLNPLLLVVSYFLIFGLLLDTKRGVTNFIAFLSIGVVVFGYSSAAITKGTKAIVGNMGLVRALRFPRALLPLSVTLTEFLMTLPAMAVLLIVMLITHEPLTWRWILLPVALGIQTGILAGLVLMGARLVNVARDIGNLIPVMIRLLRYISGVFLQHRSVCRAPPDRAGLPQPATPRPADGSRAPMSDGGVPGQTAGVVRRPGVGGRPARRRFVDLLARRGELWPSLSRETASLPSSCSHVDITYRVQGAKKIGPTTDEDDEESLFAASSAEARNSAPSRASKPSRMSRSWPITASPIGIIGRNGSGKSTLLRAIAGLIPPTRGRIWVSGEPSLLGVNAVLMSKLSGERNVFIGGQAQGLTQRPDSRALRRHRRLLRNRRLDLSPDEDLLLRPGRAAPVRHLHGATTPDILMIDEALATGDADFKERSAAKVAEIRRASLNGLPRLPLQCHDARPLLAGAVDGEGRAPGRRTHRGGRRGIRAFRSEPPAKPAQEERRRPSRRHRPHPARTPQAPPGPPHRCHAASSSSPSSTTRRTRASGIGRSRPSSPTAGR
jgi:teichoic acid transport system permease protein